MQPRDLCKYLLFLGCLHLFPQPAFTADAKDPGLLNPEFSQKFDYSESGTRGEFFVGLEVGQLRSALSSTTCFGPRIGIDYALGSKFSVAPSFSLGSDGSQFVYSGLSGYLRYSIFGEGTEKHQKLRYNGVSVYEQSSKRTDRLAVGVGLEQLFLNGSTSVYPSVGFSGAVSYSFEAFGRQIETAARYSSMTANRQPMNALFLDVSFLFGL